MPVATLVPHVLSARRARVPAVLDRRAAAADARSARGCGGAGRPARGARARARARRSYNGARARLGLAPLPYAAHRALALARRWSATLPQLEYPREWPAWMRVVGPLMWEPPGERVEPPPGDGPVVLVAPSTAQDRRALAAARGAGRAWRASRCA